LREAPCRPHTCGLGYAECALDVQRGVRYGAVTPGGVEALRFLAAREGLLLDPV